MYSVDRVDVTPEIEKQAEWATLANAAHCSISSETSTVSTLYL